MTMHFQGLVGQKHCLPNSYVFIFKLKNSVSTYRRSFFTVAVRDKQVHGFIKQGPQNYSDFLQFHCLKLWMDDAMGSRGAALLKPYSDDLTNEGLLLWEEEFHTAYKKLKPKGFK